MKTVLLGPPPAELASLIAKRHALGQDLFDEVWEGDYHMVPAPRPAHGYVVDELVAILRPRARAAGLVGTSQFNLGCADDYRVPDWGFHQTLPTETWVPTAAIVVEVVSPDDETYEKFGFYAANAVDELIVADPASRQVTCWRRDDHSYDEVPGSERLGITAEALTAAIDWPA